MSIEVANFIAKFYAMKNLIRLEELLQFLFSIYLFSLLPYAWYWFLILILTPDIGMLGYIKNAKLGAFTYNLFHHKGLAIGIYLLGIFLQMHVLSLIGIILFGHSSMDRMFGYGLKYNDSFKNTHLGPIGKS